MTTMMTHRQSPTPSDAGPPPALHHSPPQRYYHAHVILLRKRLLRGGMVELSISSKLYRALGWEPRTRLAISSRHGILEISPADQGGQCAVSHHTSRYLLTMPTWLWSCSETLPIGQAVVPAFVPRWAAANHLKPGTLRILPVDLHLGA